jgi:hypothetical protein
MIPQRLPGPLMSNSFRYSAPSIAKSAASGYLRVNPFITSRKEGADAVIPSPTVLIHVNPMIDPLCNLFPIGKNFNKKCFYFILIRCPFLIRWTSLLAVYPRSPANSA